MSYCKKADTVDYSKMRFDGAILKIIDEIGCTEVVHIAREGEEALSKVIYSKMLGNADISDIDLGRDEVCEEESRKMAYIIYVGLFSEGYIRSDMSHLEWDKLLALLSFIGAYKDRSYVDYGACIRKLKLVRQVLEKYCNEYYDDRAAYETYDSIFPTRVYEAFLGFLPPEQMKYVNWACKNSLQSDVGFQEYYLSSDEKGRLENGYLNFVLVINSIIMKLKEDNEDNVAFLELLREEGLS